MNPEDQPPEAVIGRGSSTSVFSGKKFIEQLSVTPKGGTYPPLQCCFGDFLLFGLLSFQEERV